jgi:ribbon-helix-helix protein
MKSPSLVHLEERTARLTILIDPRKKAVFERLCSQEDLTPSQVVRRMIRGYIETRLGRPWTPGGDAPVTGGGSAVRSTAKRRTART